jgi:TonB-linked SusC/RagA family outer membrane protein
MRKEKSMSICGYPLFKRILLLLILVMGFTTFIFAQNPVKKNPTVTLTCRNEPLSSVLKKVEQSTGYKVLFTYDDIQSYKVSVSMEKKPLEAAIKQIIAPFPLSFNIKGIFISIFVSHQNGVRRNHFTGHVSDKDGEALPGVNITTDNRNVNGITNGDGDFDFTIPEGQSVGSATFSFIGYKTLKVNNRGSKLRIVMESETQELGEVVVTGLVTHNTKSFTGDASVYKGEDLKTVGRQNVIKSLSILDPTVAIVENTEMGSNPNTMPTIRFRGESSFQGFENIDKSGLMSDPNQPLFILDGYQTSLSTIVDLDMNQVESVTVLKDAAAQAIYGSRAANGVIVVKTIQPAEGQMRISYGFNTDINLPDLSSYNLLNAKENVELYQRLGMYRNDDGTLMAAYNQIARWVAQGVDTDWLSKPLRNSVGMKHSLNLSGGDRRMRYGLDLNYTDNPGVMKESSRNNYGIGVRLSYNLNDKFLFTNHLSVSRTNSKESPYGSFADYTTINSFYPIYDENGKLYKTYYYETETGAQSNYWGNASNIPINPLYEASVGNMNKTDATSINDNFSLDWTIMPGLRLTSMISYTKGNSKATSFLSPNSATYADYTGGVGSATAEEEALKGKYTYSETFQDYIEGNMMATYSKVFGKHFVTASAGGSLSDSKSTVYGFVAQGFGEEDDPEPAYASQYEEGGTPSNSEGHTRLASFFASGNYAYDNRYLFDFSYRLDGSSQFGTKEKSAPFYSFGVGWNAHNEKFIKDLKFINLLKLRATYGEVGSVSFSPYQARDMYSYTTNSRYDGNIGLILEGLGNKDLKWQTTDMYEFGAQLGLFNRIDASISVYRKTTKDMVLPITTPPSMGFSSYIANLGKMRNTGYEISLRGFLLKSKGFNVSLFGTMTHNKNKILAISSALESFNKKVDAGNGTSGNEYIQLTHKLLTKYEEGQSSTAIYAVRSLGIDPMTGEELFLDKNGKPTWTWDADNKVVVGDSEAKVRGSFGTNIGYKGLYLNATFLYQAGGQIYNSTLVDKVENSNKYKNVDKRVLTETWQKPGDVVRYKANITRRYAQAYTYASSRFVQDYDYLQLSSLSLQYEMPKKFIAPLRMESLRWSFNMSDVFYWSTVKRERGTSYPYCHAFSIGLRANF